MASAAPATSLPLTASRHTPALDTVRVLAILLVVSFHYPSEGAPGWFARIAGVGWVGVDLFFVLSGFLIGRQMLAPPAQGKEPRLGNFWMRRVLRILPAYWVVLAVYVLVPIAREAESMAPVWKFLTFTQNIGLEGGAFSHAWSLCIEEHFYLVLPLLVLMLSGRIGPRGLVRLVLALIVLGIVLRIGLWWMHLQAPPPGASLGRLYRRWIYYPTWTRLDGLLAGMTPALVQTFRPGLWGRWTRAPWRAAALSAGCFILAWPLCDENKTLISSALLFPLLALGFALLIVLAMTDVGARLFGAVPGAHWFASVTYCVYLSHKLTRRSRQWGTPVSARTIL
jgi:peptidoglycan/LPS O-acetylase OafA/YrhL